MISDQKIFESQILTILLAGSKNRAFLSPLYTAQLKCAYAMISPHRAPVPIDRVISKYV